MIQDNNDILCNVKWAANILSVKGSFKINKKSVYIRFVQIHKDIPKTFYKYFGGYIHIDKRAKKNNNRKDMHVWRLYGDAAIGLLMSMYDLMPVRRQEEIKKCVDIWKQASYPPDMSGFSEETWEEWGRDSGFGGAKEWLECLIKTNTRVEMAEIIGVSPTTISTRLHKLGITTVKPLISDVRIESIRRRYRMLGGHISWSRLGRQLGVSRYLAEKYAKGSLDERKTN